MNRPIKIWFSDFWNGFDYYNNYFTNLLSTNFNVEVNPHSDFLIHSVYSKNFLKHPGYRICYTGENTRPDFTSSDFHIGFDYLEDPRYLRWPLFLLYFKPEQLLRSKQDPEVILRSKSRFCTFVVSNPHANARINFFKELSLYKRIDSGGRVLNNTGTPLTDKMNFIKGGKFCISFENDSYPGYTTEKLWEPFVANTVPIYWGNPLVHKEFNSQSFVNVHAFENNREAIKRIIEIDNDDKLYCSMVSESPYYQAEIPEQFKTEKILDYFEKIFSLPRKKKSKYVVLNMALFYNYRIRSSIFKLRKKFQI